jgi:hypothetical protein
VAVPEPAEDELEQLAYDLALRTLGQQERLLEELRARTGVLLTATAIVVSFLGGRALAASGDAWLTLTGTVAAIASIVLAVYVLLPKSGFTFALHGAAVYEHFRAERTPIRDVQRTLSYWLKSAWDENQNSIDRLIVFFRLACGLLVLAIGLWSLELALD